MCRTHSYDELANIMVSLSGLFAWRKRGMLAESAEILRTPSRGLRHPALSRTEAERGEQLPDLEQAAPTGL